MSKRLRADLALAFCTLLWGGTFVVVKASLAYASVFIFLAVRFSLAAALLAAFQPRIFHSLRRAEWLAGAALGFFMFGGYAFQTAGLVFTTPSKSGLVTGLCVVLVPLLLAIFWRRRLTPWVYAGAVGAMLGLYFLTVPTEGIQHLNKGDVLTFVAAAMFAMHIILVGQYSRRHSVAGLSVLQVAACAAFSWVAAGGMAALGWQKPYFFSRWEIYAGLVACAVLATAAAFTIQMWAQRYTTPSHAAILFTLEPVFAVLTSYAVLHERLGRRALIGAALVLAAILVAELKGPAPAAPEAPEPAGEHA